MHPVKILIPAAVVIITLGLLLQTSIPKQVLAAIPFIQTLFSEYGDEGQKKAVEKTEVQHINQTVLDNDVKVTFHEILYDGARISVSYSIEATSGRYKGKNLDIFLFNMKVDGQDLTSYGFSGGTNDKKIGNRYLKVQNIDLKKALPEKFTLNLSIQELVSVDDVGGKRIKGNWAFSLPVEKTGEAFEFTPTVSKKTELGELRVPEIVFGPSATLVKIEYKRPMNLKHSSISYNVLDPNNKKMKVLRGEISSYRYKNGIATMKTEIIFEPMKDIPEFITIQPYYDGISEIKNNKISITEKLPIFLDQGEDGGILINKIEKKQGEVWVYFDVIGDYVKVRKQRFNLMKENELQVINREGDIDNPDSKNQLIKFKTPYSEDLNFFSTTIFKQKVIKELELKIPINKEELGIQESNK
nr:DUF4179 domain-containing protein [Neobacillus notoginsengisoli]